MKSLHYKILFPLTIAAFFLILVSSYLYYLQTIEALKHQQIKHGKTLSLTLTEAMITVDDFEEMRFTLEQIRLQSPDVYGITLATKTPFIVWASNFHPQANIDHYTNEMMQTIEVSLNKGMFGYFHHKNGDLVVLTPVGISFDSDISWLESAVNLGSDLTAFQHQTLPHDSYQGVMYLRFDWQNIQQKAQGNILKQLLINTIGLIIMFLTSVALVQKFVIRPLSEISTVVSRQDEGDKDARIQRCSNDEVGFLGKSLNRMLDTLDSKEQTLKDYIASTTDFVWEMDINGQYVFVSDEVESILGYESEELIGEMPFNLMMEHEAEIFAIVFEQSLKTKRTIKDIERWSYSKKGEMVCLLTNAVPIFDESGGVTGYRGTDKDITEQKNISEQLASSEANFRQLFEANKTVELIIEQNTGRIIDANHAAVEFYGYSHEMLMSLNIKDINVFSAEQIEKEMTLAAHETRSHFNFQHRLANGDIRHVEVHSGPLIFNNKECLYSIIHDVTQQKEVEHRIQLLGEVFKNAHDGIFVCDQKANIIEVNEMFTDITGYSAEEIIGQNPRILSSGRQSKEFYQEMWEALNTEHNWSGEIWNRKKNGDLYALQTNISTILDENGAILYYISAITDITHIKDHQSELEALAHYDPLTGLPNRTLLLDRMQRAVIHAQRNQSQLAVCFIDIDNFKPFNDEHGHFEGDALLKAIADTLDSHLRAEDTVARIGGDEFILLINDINDRRALEVLLLDIVKSISQTTTQKHKPKNISCSLGVSLYPNDSGDAEKLLRNADHAMYEAKQLGKNRLHFFDATFDAEMSERHQLIEEVKTALVENKFELYYQPKLNSLTGKLVGFEALLRWNRADGKITYPDEFLPSLLGQDVEQSLDLWVLEKAISQLKAWQKKGSAYQISVNITAKSIQSSVLFDKIIQLFEKCEGIEPSLLQIEILETSVIGINKTIQENIERILALGVTIALDDFGTGHSTLTHLKNLNVNMLKIDKSFVMDMLSDSGDYVIVKGVIGLANAFNIQVIAEGVENQLVAEELVNLGCSYIQGYWVSKPLPIDEINELIRNWDNAKFRVNVCPYC